MRRYIRACEGRVTCEPTKTVAERVARLREAIVADVEEEFHDAVCVHCGKKWMANQYHPVDEVFSCGDGVRYEDYVEACRDL